VRNSAPRNAPAEWIRFLVHLSAFGLKKHLKDLRCARCRAAAGLSRLAASFGPSTKIARHKGTFLVRKSHNGALPECGQPPNPGLRPTISRNRISRCSRAALNPEHLRLAGDFSIPVPVSACFQFGTRLFHQATTSPDQGASSTRPDGKDLRHSGFAVSGQRQSNASGFDGAKTAVLVPTDSPWHQGSKAAATPRVQPVSESSVTRMKMKLRAESRTNKRQNRRRRRVTLHRH